MKICFAALFGTLLLVSPAAAQSCGRVTASTDCKARSYECHPGGSMSRSARDAQIEACRQERRGLRNNKR